MPMPESAPIGSEHDDYPLLDLSEGGLEPIYIVLVLLVCWPIVGCILKQCKLSAERKRR